MFLSIAQALLLNLMLMVTLYYDLENRYGYTKDDGSKVHFFSLGAGEDRHCVNLPLLASVLAGLRYENKRFMFLPG